MGIKEGHTSVCKCAVHNVFLFREGTGVGSPVKCLSRAGLPVPGAIVEVLRYRYGYITEHARLSNNLVDF